jgi:transcriptional regulator with XRE-family HTH domain
LGTTVFYEKIKALRLAKGLSLRSMSEELEHLGLSISHAGIARWERYQEGDGLHLPKRQAISALSRLFDVSAAWLMEDVYPSVSTTASSRERQMDNLELLTDTEFEIILNLKNQFLTSKNNPINLKNIKSLDYE